MWCIAKICNSLLPGAAHTESFSGLRVHLLGQGQPEQKMEMEGWASLSPQQQRKWIHTGIIHSLALCPKALLMLHYSSAWEQQENWLPRLVVMEKVRASLRADAADCRAATVMAGRGPAPQEVACSHMYDAGPEQDRGRHFQRKAWGIQAHLK